MTAKKIILRTASVAIAAGVMGMSAVPALYALLSVWRLDPGMAFLFGMMAAAMFVLMGLPALSAAAHIWTLAGKEAGEV